MEAGRSGLVTFAAFELMRSIVFSIALSLGYSKHQAEKFAFDSAITAAAVVAVSTSVVTGDWIGATISAGLLCALVKGHHKKSRHYLAT